MNTLVVVVEVLLVVVISVKVMMVIVIVVVNCGREDGGGDVVSVYNHQGSRHNQNAITEALTVTQFSAFTLCLFFLLARSLLIFMTLPVSSCQFLLGHPV